MNARFFKIYVFLLQVSDQISTMNLGEKKKRMAAEIQKAQGAFKSVENDNRKPWVLSKDPLPLGRFAFHCGLSSSYLHPVRRERWVLKVKEIEYYWKYCT